MGGGVGGGKFMFGRTFSFEQHCPVFKKQTMFLEYLSRVCIWPGKWKPATFHGFDI